MKIILITTVSLCFLFSCSKNKEKQNFTITTFMKVNLDYQGSVEKKIRFKGDYYTPMMELKYKKNHLLEMTVYKSEGPLTYKREDFKADSLLLNYFGIDSLRNVKLSTDSLLDNSSKFLISRKIENDTIYCVRGDSLHRYFFY